MDSLFRDVRYALRMLAKTPAFFAVAVATVALGIGATTTMFSVLYAVLLKPLPYPEPQRIIRVYQTNKNGGRMMLSRLDFEDWRAQSTSFAALTAFRSAAAPLADGAEPDLITAGLVTDGFAEVLGVPPLMGRWFLADASVPEVVISERLWNSHFARAPDVLGRTVRIAQQPYTVVGIMPAHVEFPSAAQAWGFLDLSGDDSTRSAHNYHVIGRLKPGVDLASAQAEMQTIAARIAAQYPDSNADVGAALLPLQEVLTANIRPTLLLLLAMVALVMLIAAANVGNLMLVRTASRTRELAVRAALGASSSRLAGQLLTESLILFAVGGAIGLLLAAWLTGLLPSLVPGLRNVSAELDPVTLVFAAAISIFAGILVGLVPAFGSRRLDLVNDLRTSTATGVRGERLRGALIVSEVALCAVLLVGAALAARTLAALQSEDLGFDPQNVVSVYAPVSSGGADPAARYQRALERLRSLPGVVSAAATNAVPMSGGGSNGNFVVEGGADPDNTWAQWDVVDEEYFRTLKIPLLNGRTFAASDRGRESLVVINESAARRYWPGQDPVGRRLAIPGFDQQTYDRFRAGSNEWFTVIGVVGDVRDEAVAEAPDPHLYIPYFQRRAVGLSFLLRTNLPTESVSAAARQVIREIDPTVPVRVNTLDAMIRSSIVTPRLRSILIAAFAGLAFVLAAVGLYGVISYAVERRTAEMGIRAALGASAADLVRLVVGRGLVLVLIGLGVGLGLVLLLRSLIAGFLYGVAPHDPVALLAVVFLLVGMGMVAALLPARRAARVDPMVALRYE